MPRTMTEATKMYRVIVHYVWFNENKNQMETGEVIVGPYGMPGTAKTQVKRQLKYISRREGFQILEEELQVNEGWVKVDA